MGVWVGSGPSSMVSATSLSAVAPAAAGSEKSGSVIGRGAAVAGPRAGLGTFRAGLGTFTGEAAGLGGGVGGAELGGSGPGEPARCSALLPFDSGAPQASTDSRVSPAALRRSRRDMI
ncbi:hypothetical protein GCM10009760_52370 [Kitasatospora kazusensis]|uniref:Uncharacterized protein n=1 Tax=Kitasatospora kazusensis TaxID=407974 RepID=A0ABN3A4W4_9ACTN